VASLAEIDPRKVAEVVHRSRDKKTTPLQHIFSRCLRNPSRDFAGNVQGLVFSGLNPNCQVSSKSIQVFRDLLAKSTFQIVTIIGDPIGYRIADKKIVETLY